MLVIEKTNPTETLDPDKVLDEIHSEKYMGRSIKDIIRDPAPKPKHILANGILVVESKAAIYAKPKAGKSLLSVQLGLSCASSLPFLDISVLKTVNVLYLNFEVHPSILEERIIGIKEKLGLTEVPKFKYLTLLGEDIPLLDTKEGYGQVRAILKVQDSHRFHVDLLIWDCRYKTFTKSENEDDVMKLWCRNMETLINDFKFTPLIVHHKGKATVGVGAGSNVFDRWVNTAIEIQPDSWESALKPSKGRKILIGGNYTADYENYTLLEYPIHVIGAREVPEKPLNKKQIAMDFIVEELECVFR